jgi:hypothetical protein
MLAKEACYLLSHSVSLEEQLLGLREQQVQGCDIGKEPVTKNPLCLLYGE